MNEPSPVVTYRKPQLCRVHLNKPTWWRLKIACALEQAISSGTYTAAHQYAYIEVTTLMEIYLNMRYEADAYSAPLIGDVRQLASCNSLDP